MLKIRRPLGRLIFNMGIATPGKTVFLIETAPSRLALSCNTGVYMRSVVSEPGLRAGTINYIPRYLWDIITCPCPWCLVLAKHSYETHANIWIKHQCHVMLRLCNMQMSNYLSLSSPLLWLAMFFLPNLFSSRHQTHRSCHDDVIIWNPLRITSFSFAVNTLRPRQNGHHFADDTLKWTFLNENVSI